MLEKLGSMQRFKVQAAWVNYWIFLNLIFFLCKIVVIIVATS